MPTRVARVYLPFGASDNPSKMIPQAVAALRDQRPMDLSPCTQRRDLIGVGDLCNGYLALAADLRRGRFEIFNLGSGEAIALRDFLLAIAGRLGADPAVLRFGARPMRPGEPEVSVGDNAKARHWLDWMPRPLEQAVDEDLLGTVDA